jgi:hypothetical protein
MLGQLIAPHRQPHFQTELLQARYTAQLAGSLRPFRFANVSANVLRGAIGKANQLTELIEHYITSERGGQGRGDNTVIAARWHARQRPGGIASESVGH